MSAPKLDDLKVNDYVVSTYTWKFYKVKEVNHYWGWFKVYETDRIFRLSDSWQYVSKEKMADVLLAKANAGVDDSWSEQ